MTTPSLDQKRAAYAWKKVQGMGDDYGKLAKGAPALIMNNGLMQTLAYYQDKNDNHYHFLNQHIIDWLAIYMIDNKIDNITFNNMMQYLLEADSPTYRKATEETLALLRWIRQFSAINA